MWELLMSRWRSMAAEVRRDETTVSNEGRHLTAFRRGRQNRELKRERIIGAKGGERRVLKYRYMNVSRRLIFYQKYQGNFCSELTCGFDSCQPTCFMHCCCCCCVWNCVWIDRIEGEENKEGTNILPDIEFQLNYEKCRFKLISLIEFRKRLCYRYISYISMCFCSVRRCSRSGFLSKRYANIYLHINIFALICLW